jgi:hypothetical protein
MLFLGRENFIGEPRVYIEYRGVEAWIAKRPLFGNPGRDWQLWVRRGPGFPARTGKSPVRLAIESRLRAWILSRYKRPLFTLRFDELCRIAEHEGGGFSERASEFRH